LLRIPIQYMIFQDLKPNRYRIRYLVNNPALHINENISLGELMNRDVQIIAKEADTALLSNASKAVKLLGKPVTELETILKWTAHWVNSVGIFLNKPTHFEVRDGKY
jgi:hypothetical protein